ncbi:hypothetical protein HJD18_13885 [Thermoleophilia bacterium SCSIO 60948]|nr:hypothetical protein HJD18_13885 [Thermoleophilia bacterium SCSIO 60948]
MSRLKYFNPFRIRRFVREVRNLSGHGGPARLRLVGAENPRGIIFPTSKFVVEVEMKDGHVADFAPLLPIPWPYAWSYRIAHRLGVPLVSSVDPEKIRFDLAVPRGRKEA